MDQTHNKSNMPHSIDNLKLHRIQAGLGKTRISPRSIAKHKCIEISSQLYKIQQVLLG